MSGGSRSCWTRDCRVARSEDCSERFERGVVQAASLIKHFIDERAEVRLVLGDEVGPFGSGTEQLYRCLRRLALVTPIDGDEPET